ncbi:MAG: HAMP domain-containing protein, partial [Chloroflexota bacterium]
MSASASRLRQWLPARWRWPAASRPLGLQSRIALLVASGLLALMTLFVALGLSALRESTQRGFQERAVLAQMAAEHLDFILEQAATMVSWSGQELAPILQSGNQEATRPLLQTAGHRIAFVADNLLLFDSSGLLLQAEPPDPAFSYPVVSPRAIETLASGRSLAVDWLRTPRGVVALVLVPLSGQSRTGYLAAAVDFSGPTVGHWLRQLAIGKSGRVDVVDGEGMVLTTTDAQDAPSPESHASYFAGLMAESRATVATCYDCHATSQGPARSREVMAFAPLRMTNWGVVLRQSEDEVLEPTHRLQRQVLGLGVISLLVALFMVWLTTRSVVGPIRALTQSARRIAEGQLSEAVAVQGADEVGELARTLDYMRGRLQRSMEEIKGCNAELDRRVRERTTELERSRDEVESSRDYLQTMIDSLGDELMVIDRNFQVKRVNAALARGLRGASSPVGRPCYLVTHGKSEPCGPPCCECPAKRVWERGEPVRVLHLHSAPGDRTRYVEIVASPLRDRDGQVVELIEAMRDVTEERELEDELLRRNRELSTLNSIAVALNQSLDLEPILNAALLNALRLTGMESGAIYLVDEHTGELELAAHHGLSREAAQVAANLGLSASLCAAAAQAGDPIVVEDTARYARGMKSVLRSAKMRCMVRVPFKSTRGLLGTM